MESENPSHRLLAELLGDRRHPPRLEVFHQELVVYEEKLRAEPQRGVSRTLHRFITGLGLLAFGHFDAVWDVLDNYRRRDPAGVAINAAVLVVYLNRILPLPANLDALDAGNHDAIRVWLKRNADRLEWRETTGRYVVRQ
jgi:hypothetical protein